MTQDFHAIILSRRTFGEQDHSMVFLSEDGSRIEAIAKGTQNPGSRRKSHLEPLNQVAVSLRNYRGKSYIQAIETLRSYQALKQNYDSLIFAQTLLEILNQMLMPEHAHEAIYQILKNALEEMDQEEFKEKTPILPLTQLAHHFGLLPSFKHCGKCYEEIPEEAHWNSEDKSLRCNPCQSTVLQNPFCEVLPLKYRKALEFLRSCPPGAHRSLKFEDEESQILQKLTLDVLKDQLKRPLNSLKWA